MAIEAAPIIVKPSGDFIGNDGSWSSFYVDVGVPPQALQVLPSTEASMTLLVVGDGCTDDDPSNCEEARGGIYNNTKSSQWVRKGFYMLNLETNLGMTSDSDRGEVGYDQLSIRTDQGGNVTMDQQVTAGVATKDFFVGSLGLSQLPINFTQPVDSRPSFISHLKNQSLIPSSSYGFTAGASYHNATASLTLGGYDSSRFVPNDVSFGLGTNAGRQLVVGLEKITYSDSDNTDEALLTEGILTLIDSTVPTIWLPLDACHAFEKAFGIVYDPIPNMYLVNDTVHDDLLKQNASITFQIANTLGSTDSVNITLPYASFDLELGYPFVNKSTKYFPLRIAADDTQYTLGRTFLQEAYLIVDYENKNFSVSQTTFANAPAHIVAMQANNGTGNVTTSSGGGGGGTITKTTNHSSKSFPVGAIAGIVVAVILIAFVSGFFTARWYRRSRSGKSKQRMDGCEELDVIVPYPHGKVEVEEDNGRHSSDGGPTEKKGAMVSTYQVAADSPGIEIGSSDSYVAHHHGVANHGANRVELPGSPPPPPSRSEAPSPEPQWSRAEMSTPEPPLELWVPGAARVLTEMPSPDQRPTLINTSTPSSELPSALQSPTIPRPTRRPAQHPPHVRQGSSDSISAYTPTNPSHLRNDSNDTGVRPASIRKYSDDSGVTQDTMVTPRLSRHNTENDPLVSPIQRPEQRRSNSEDTIETRMENNGISGSTYPSRNRSGRRQNSGPPSALTSPQLGSMSEEAMTEEPSDVVDLKK